MAELFSNPIVIVEASTMSVLPQVVPRPDLFLVIAQRDDGLWTMPSVLRDRMPYGSLSVATADASQLSAAWTHRRVVRIPGEDNDSGATLESPENTSSSMRI